VLAVHIDFTQGFAEGKGDFRGHGVGVSLSTNSVGSKELSFHNRFEIKVLNG